MSKKSYLDHLRKVPMFAGLSDKELAEVDHLATTVKFPDGEVLMTEGHYAQEMFIVLSGTLAVAMDGEQLTTLSDGAFVGELALLTRSHRSATVTTVGEVEALVLDGREFSSMLDDVPQIAVKMLPIVAQRAADNAHAHDLQEAAEAKLDGQVAAEGAGS